MLGKGLESLIPSGGYKKPEESQPTSLQGYGAQPSAPINPDSAPRPAQGYGQPIQQQPRPATEQPQAAAYPPVPGYQDRPTNFQEPARNPYDQSQIIHSAPQQDQGYGAYGAPASAPYPSPVVPSYQQQPDRPPVVQNYEQPPVQRVAEPQYPPIDRGGVPGFPPERDIMPEENRDISVFKAPDHAARGLSDDYSVRQDAVFQIEVEKIFPNPQQPRRYFDEGALNDLANSIREFGIIQPLVVTKVFKETDSGTDVTYQLIAGERRLMAAKKVGLRTVPAVVKQVSMDRERLELAIIENIQRENLNPLEAARSYARLQDEFGLTQREIAIRMGKSRETIANTLRLLNLPSEVQKALEEGKINESHARLLLQVTDQAKQREMFDSILHFKPSVRELKAKLRQDKNSGFGSQGYANPELASLQSRLEESLGTRVQISDEGEKGKIMISYYSPEELNGLIRKLSGGNMY